MNIQYIERETIMSTVINENTKLRIAEVFMAGGLTKAAVARKFGVSTRTVGRAVDLYKCIKKNHIPPSPVQEEIDFTPHHPTAYYNYTYVCSPDMINIMRNNEYGEVESESITSEDDRFTEVFNHIMQSHLLEKQGEDELAEYHMAEAFKLMSIPDMIKERSHGRVTANVNTGKLTYINGDGETRELHGSLVDRILGDMSAGQTQVIDNLLKFTDNLLDNVSYDAVNRLYDFLRASDVEIDEDGYVVCFKKVKDDYTDVRTGTFDNSIGTIVTMPRNEVDEDSNNTCSSGLHVCSKFYLNKYPGERIIRVRVDPANVVAIPRDYNDSKMRVCMYEVIDDVTGMM